MSDLQEYFVAFENGDFGAVVEASAWPRALSLWLREEVHISQFDEEFVRDGMNDAMVVVLEGPKWCYGPDGDEPHCACGAPDEHYHQKPTDKWIEPRSFLYDSEGRIAQAIRFHVTDTGFVDWYEPRQEDTP